MASNPVAEAVLGVRDLFHENSIRSLEVLTVYRLKDNEEAMIEACKLDLGKPSYETYMAEAIWSMNDIIFVCDNLGKWMRDESAPDIDFSNKLMSPKIRKDPLGAVLVIGYDTYPTRKETILTTDVSNVEHTTSPSNSP
jgi:beta-apo-4'-carotenal oxygenase